MAGTLAPQVVFTGFDNNGIIMPGGKLYTFTSGTTAAATTWTDSGLTVPNANPIILDSAGRAVIYLALGVAYKFILKTSADVTIWSQDPVNSVPSRNVDIDVAGVSGSISVMSLNDLIFLEDTTGSVPGGWLRMDGDFTASSNAVAVVGFLLNSGGAHNGDVISVRVAGRMVGLSGLVAGSAYYASGTPGQLTVTPPANARFIGIADTTSTLVMATQSLVLGQPLFSTTPIYKAGADTAYNTVTDGTLLAFVDTADHANGTTAETVFSTFSFPPILNAVQKSLKASFSWAVAANGNTKTMRFYFGATAVTVYTGTQNGGTGHAEMWVTRTGATTQKITGFMTAVNAAGTSTSGSFSTTSAETLSAAVTVKTSGQSGTTSADITQSMFIPQVVGA